MSPDPLIAGVISGGAASRAVFQQLRTRARIAISKSV